MKSLNHSPWWITLATLFFVVGAFGLAEIALRVTGRAEREMNPDTIERLIERSRPLFQERSLKEKYLFVRKADPFTPNPASGQFFLPKPAGNYRVFVVGESSAQNLASGLRKLLEGSSTERTVEVIDAGIRAAGFLHVEKTFDEVLAYSPDAIVLFFGHNWAAPSSTAPRWASAIGTWAWRSRLIGAFLSEPPPLDPNVILPRYRQFLIRAAQECKERGVHFAVCTAHSNHWFPPTSTAADSENETFLRAVYEKIAYSGRLGIPVLERLIDETPSAPALWHFELAEWLYFRGHFREASKHFQEAIDKDFGRYRAVTGLNEMIRKTTMETGASLLDIDQLIASSAPNSIAGWETFRDNCHWSEARDGLIAQECLRLLQQKGAPSVRLTARREQFSSVNWGSLKAPASNLHFWTGPLAYSVLHALKTSPDQTESAVDVFFASIESAEGGVEAKASRAVDCADGFWKAGKGAKALALLGLAEQLMPKWEKPHIHKGFVLLDSGKQWEALEEFAKASKLNPANKVAQFFQKQIMQSGDHDNR